MRIHVKKPHMILLPTHYVESFLLITHIHTRLHTWKTGPRSSIRYEFCESLIFLEIVVC